MLKKIWLMAMILLLLLMCVVSEIALAKGEEERQVNFKSGNFTLFGTLSIPAQSGGGKLPVVILVHGSGPLNRDEEISQGFTVRPFAELAKGLKKAGFAVLRYDKRTYTMLKSKASADEVGQVMPDQFIEDARAAIDYVKSFPEIDANRVILLGHSEGAGFLYRVVQGKKVAGVVLVAPNLLPVREQVLYQLNYQIRELKKQNSTGMMTSKIQQMEQLKIQVESALDSISNGSYPENAFILGSSPAFWRRLNELSVKPIEEIVALKEPVLLINGTADFLAPIDLLREKEGQLRKKKGLKVAVIDGMGYDMYNQSKGGFENQMVTEIVNWVKQIPGFGK